MFTKIKMSKSGVLDPNKLNEMNQMSIKTFPRNIKAIKKGTIIIETTASKNH